MGGEARCVASVHGATVPLEELVHVIRRVRDAEAVNHEANERKVTLQKRELAVERDGVQRIVDPEEHAESDEGSPGPGPAAAAAAVVAAWFVATASALRGAKQDAARRMRSGSGTAAAAQSKGIPTKKKTRSKKLEAINPKDA